MNTKISLCIVVALAAAMAVSTEASGVSELRAKYRSMRNNGQVGGEHQGGYAMGGAGGAAAAASAGPHGVTSSAAAGGRYFGQQQQQQVAYAPAHQQGHRMHRPRVLHHQQQYVQPEAQYYGGASATAGGYYANGRQQAAYEPMVRHSAPIYASQGGMIDTEEYYPEESVYSNQYVAEPVPAPRQAYNQYAAGQQQRRYQPGRFAKSHGHGGHVHPAATRYAPPSHAGVATSSAAAAVGGGAAAAAAAVSGGHQQQYQQQQHHAAPEHDLHRVDVEERHEGFHEPETVQEYAAASGTYANDGKNGAFEEGSYVRDTESLEKHEDGREDGDHYYNAQSYGKTNDVNKYTAFNNDDEDVVHTPNLFRKKKTNTNYVSSFNKAHRETGSGVVAHDKHSASYNKNSKKVKENVDQKYSKTSDGSVTTKDKNTHADIDEEDEEEMDTRGLGTFVGVDGVAHAKRQAQPVAAAASAAAGTAGAGAAAASSTFAKG